jgi:ribonuclease Z
MNLEAFVLGCGGMMPLPYRHLTSVLIRREGELFLFDAGEATQISIRRLNLRWKKITAIFISHMHADHVTGLPGILMLNSQVDREEPLYIFGPPRIAEYVEQTRRSLDMYINYEIIVKEFSEPTTLWQDPDFSIRAFGLRHTKMCFGYAFEEQMRPGAFHPEKALAMGVPRGPLWSVLQGGQCVTLPGGLVVQPEEVLGSPRSGRKICYVTDSLYFSEIAREVSGSDLLICEGMFEDALLSTAVEKRHMTARQAALIAREAVGIKLLGLIHYSPRYSDKELRVLLKEAQEVFSDTVLTRDRMNFPIENVD